MIPVFDGHNDSIAREGEPDPSRRLPVGHLDLSRMRQGGMRAASSRGRRRAAAGWSNWRRVLADWWQ